MKTDARSLIKMSYVMSCSGWSYRVTFKKAAFARDKLRFTAIEEICLALLSVKGSEL